MAIFNLSKQAAPVRAATLVLGLALMLPLGVAPADARVGGGFSFGSRGTRTFSMPSATTTAPRPAAPIQRTESPSSIGSQSPGFAPPRRFGFGSGLAAGLLGAGLLGMLTGNGFFGGLGGLGSLFGLVLQIGLIVLAVRFAIGLFRSRSPAYSGPSGPMPRPGFGGFSERLAAFRPGARSSASQPVPIGPDDFAAFERMLSDVQYAHSREDVRALSRLTTPEMLRFMSADLEANRGRGVRNEMADVRLLQGDLAESWQEGSAQYATVAMRFAARDTMLDRATGRLVSGDPNRAVEVTELWTFRRDAGGSWLLSAVQQAG